MLLIVALIIGLLLIWMLQKKRNDGPLTNTNIIKEAGIDTSSHKTILDSSKKIIKDAEATRANLP